MKIQIRSPHFRVTSALRRYIHNRLQRSLKLVEKRVAGLTLWLKDLNGPRGGEDMRCRILARLDGIGSGIITAEDTDLYVAIDKAANRLQAWTQKALGKRRSQSRKPLPLWGWANQLTSD